ncbi:MAG: hypothetical protein H6740_14275 [Alphaproteobacteria bacterium]|nr:hypothetical protein [Alphaproteobacteria bacterium]
MSLLMLLLLPLARALPPADAGWSLLTETDHVRVECVTYEAQPWCRSTTTLDAPLTEVEAVLQDFSRYTKVFKRVVACDPVGDDLVRIRLDMPVPLADRDYVARFVRSQEGQVVVFRWTSDTHPAVPPEEGVVRLPRSAGEWRLAPAGGQRTAITYTWQAELGGDVPEWALPRAWGIQGEEVLRWLGEGVVNAPD